jgi:hypothetical protein
MPLRAPVSYILDRYRYWLGKRDGRAISARSDIDPADIRALLPYLAVVHKSVGQFRFRLGGIAVVEQRPGPIPMAPSQFGIFAKLAPLFCDR